MDIAQWHAKAADISLMRSDIVRIREDLVLGEVYGGVHCTKDMLYYRGAATRIERIWEAANKDEYYYLAADDEGNVWSREMLGFANKEDLKNNKQLIVGSWVKVADADTLYRWHKQCGYSDDDIKNVLKDAGKEGVINGFNFKHELCRVNIAGQSGRSIVRPRELLTLIYKDWHVYELGERVRVRSDVETMEEYDGGCQCVEEMACYRGECSEITRIRKDNRFQLEITGGTYWWSPSMLEPIKGD